jgi:hypothetical protein
VFGGSWARANAKSAAGAALSKAGRLARTILFDWLMTAV